MEYIEYNYSLFIHFLLFCIGFAMFGTGIWVGMKFINLAWQEALEVWVSFKYKRDYIESFNPKDKK